MTDNNLSAAQPISPRRKSSGPPTLTLPFNTPPTAKSAHPAARQRVQMIGSAHKVGGPPSLSSLAPIPGFGGPIVNGVPRTTSLTDLPKPSTPPTSDRDVKARDSDNDSSPLGESLLAISKTNSPSNSSNPSPTTAAPILTRSLLFLDLDQDVEFEEENNKLVLKGGTMKKIIEWMAFEQSSTKESVIQLLLTYQLYISNEAFFEEVKDIFLSKHPTTQEILKPKLLVLLLEWAERRFATDFRKKMFGRLFQFINQVFPDKRDKESEEMDVSNKFKLIAIRALLKQIPHRFEQPPIAFDWMSVKAGVVAAQLSLLIREMFLSIQPTEFHNCAWSKPNKEQKAPTLVRLASFFNSLSFWFATQILKDKNILKQVQVLKRCVRIADKLFKMHNFDCLGAVVSCFNSAAITRLKKLWNELPEKYIAIKEKLNETMDGKSNYKVYRETVAALPRDTPIIPLLSVYLRDITFISELPTRLEGTNLINAHKITSLGARIHELQNLISVPYPDTVDSQLRQFFLTLTYWEEDELYDHSLVCEPSKKGVAPSLPTIEEADESEESWQQRHTQSAPSLAGTISPQSESPRTEGVRSWGVNQVLSWLDTLELGELKDIFRQNAIDGNKLLALDDAQLQKLPVKALGHRKKLLKQITTVLPFQTSQPTVPVSLASCEFVNKDVPYTSWTEKDVQNWLTFSIKDPEINDALQGVTGADLDSLNLEAIQYKYKVGKLGLRKKLHRQLLNLKSGESPQESVYYKEFNEWNTSDVCAWLDISELSDLKPYFQSKNVQGSELGNITHETLTQMGVSILRMRKSFLSAFQALKEHAEFKKVSTAVPVYSIPRPRRDAPKSNNASPMSTSPTNPSPLLSYMGRPKHGRKASSDSDSLHYSDDDNRSEHSYISYSTQFNCDEFPKTINVVYKNSATEHIVQSPDHYEFARALAAKRTYPLHIVMKFVDSEGDLVTITDESSFKMALQVPNARYGNRPTIIIDERSRSLSSEPESRYKTPRITVVGHDHTGVSSAPSFAL